MTTAWLTEAGDDDLLDLGELSPIAPETRPTTTLDVSPLGEISPVDANRRRVPAARAGSKPFPFAPSPVVKGATSAAQATAAFPRSPAFAPSPLAPKRAAQLEPANDSSGTLAGAAPASAPAPSPMLGGSRLAVAAAEHVPNKNLSSVDPPRGGGLSRHSRRQSLGLDAFQSITKGLLEEDDDFDFAPSFTPKAAKGPGAFAPSPVREEEEEEEEEEEKEEEDAVAEEEVAGPLEGIVEEEEEAEVAEAEVAKEEEVAAEAAAARAAPEPPASEAAREEAPVAPEPPAAEAEAEDAFERRLRAAMEAAERGGGLASLSGGMQNSPPGGKTSAARPAASLERVPAAVPDAGEVDTRQPDATNAQDNASEDKDSEEVHSDDDTVELRADVDVSMMDAEPSPFPRAPTPISRGTAGDAPRAPAAVLAALASPASGVKEPSGGTPASREDETETETARPTANGDDAPSESARNETAETDDAFERRLLAAMEAAERGGGLASLTGGMQNSPPGSKPAFRPLVANSPPGDEARRADTPKEDDARASGPVPDEREGKREAEATAAEKPRRSAKAKAKAKAKAPTDPDPEPEPETKGSAPSERASADDDAFERKLLAAMEAAERGGGLAGLSGGMQNSPPGSKPAKPTGAAAAPEIPSPEPETVDGDAEDVCGMDHDAPPTPKEPVGALAPSPVAAPASAKKRDAKPPRSGKKSKRARTPSLRAPEEEKEEALEENNEEEGPSPPAADFEAMLAKAMAAADGGNVDAVLGGASRKTMNSPAPPRRKTPARSAKAKTPEGTPTREKRSSARVTRASAAKTPSLAHRNVQNTPTPRGKRRAKKTPTPEKRKRSAAAKPAWVSDVTLDPEPAVPSPAKEETADASLDRSKSDGSGSEDVSPVPEAPAAPPPPPAAWLRKTAETKAKTSLKPAWVSEFAAPAAAPAAPVVAAPVAPVAAPVVIAALAAAQSRAKAPSLSSDGFDFEAKLQAALAAEAGGGAAAFGGASKVANSPTGSGEKRTEFSAKEEARRQGVTVAQIMHARAHADSSPLTKVRF